MPADGDQEVERQPLVDHIREFEFDLQERDQEARVEEQEQRLEKIVAEVLPELADHRHLPRLDRDGRRVAVGVNHRQQRPRLELGQLTRPPRSRARRDRGLIGRLKRDIAVLLRVCQDKLPSSRRDRLQRPNQLLLDRDPRSHGALVDNHRHPRPQVLEFDGRLAGIPR